IIIFVLLVGEFRKDGFYVSFRDRLCGGRRNGGRPSGRCRGASRRGRCWRGRRSTFRRPRGWRRGRGTRRCSYARGVFGTENGFYDVPEDAHLFLPHLLLFASDRSCRLRSRDVSTRTVVDVRSSSYAAPQFVQAMIYPRRSPHGLHLNETTPPT